MLLILPQNPVYHGGASPGRAVRRAGAPCLSSRAPRGLSSRWWQGSRRDAASWGLVPKWDTVVPAPFHWPRPVKWWTRIPGWGNCVYGSMGEAGSHLAKGEDTRRLFGTLFLPFWKTTVVFHKEVVRNLHFSNLSGSCNFSPLVWWFLKLPNHFWWGGILGPVLSFQMRSSSIDILLLLIHYL